jgi:Protein of unknown function (DUF3667)
MNGWSQAEHLSEAVVGRVGLGRGHMSVDIEAGGALATAGLAAKAIEGDSAPATPTQVASCANCKTPLVGAYCHACGQTAHVHRSIWHMLEEGLHGVLHFDSKMWRTLPLLFARPGLLSRRYIEGQRARYVSPLALFLFTIFLMFFVLSFIVPDSGTVEQSTPQQRQQARVDLVAEVNAAKAEVARYTTDLGQAKDDNERASISAELETAQARQRTAEFVLSTFEKATAAAADPSKPVIVTGEELEALSGAKMSDIDLTLVEAMNRLAKNPELMLYKFRNTAYKFSFMLIPISLPFLWLMFFWKRDVTTYDHMIFAMYSLSFMSILFVVMVLMGMAQFTSRLASYLAFIPPLHMFLQLKETYRLRFFPALWRTFALLISAGTVFVLFLLFVAAIIAA